MTFMNKTASVDLQQEYVSKVRQKRVVLKKKNNKKNNRFMGILPAFRHLASGETHLSCEKDGTLAPIHCIDALPGKWLTCNLDNDDCKLKAGIEKGYIVMGHFVNMDDAVNVLPH